MSIEQVAGVAILVVLALLLVTAWAVQRVSDNCSRVHKDIDALEYGEEEDV